MSSLQIDLRDLPKGPLDAAAQFYATELAEIRDDCEALAEYDLVLLFAPAGPEHGAWRLAAVQELARELAPQRVNAIAGEDPDVVMQALAYLDRAPGVTGQLLCLDGNR